uniref:Putative secreted peptide n=1 Tax=Anopheles braziliensis TaxID=58242 RepID=A0A2M3ZWV4_9DIPT
MDRFSLELLLLLRWCYCAAKTPFTKRRLFLAEASINLAHIRERSRSLGDPLGGRSGGPGSPHTPRTGSIT